MYFKLEFKLSIIYIFFSYFKMLKDNIKLNSNNLNDINNTNYRFGMNIISNKEALKDKIHEIHNYLRNNGCGYGMYALKVFNVLYGLKKIEEIRDQDIYGKYNLSDECRFSNLLQLANDNKDEELAGFIFNNVLDAIYKSDMKNLLLYEIPRNIKSYVFSYLIKEINSIGKIEEQCNVLLSGKIYEYFIGRDESAISELGAYFTDRHIVNYIYTKLGNIINPDGSIKSMIDMFGGSGGMSTGYINHINSLMLKDNIQIDWNKEINKIHHYDMNEDVVRSAGLEIFCLTGVLPDMKRNILYKNSFTDDFNNETFDLIITNPPYGGDKTKQTGTQIKRDKIEIFIKEELKTLKDEDKIKHRREQLKHIDTEKRKDKKEQEKSKVSVNECSKIINKFASDNGKLKGNDKEACSLILLMSLLKENGTAIGVLKEGVFFNKTYTDLRRILITKYNVREIISIPQDQFENTSTKTSIIIFDNSENKTKEIKFYDLVVEKYTKDKFEDIDNAIILTENKDDIKRVCDKLVSSATVEMILANKIVSLNSKDYNKKEIICGEGYELVKLGDVCSFLPKSKRNASFGQKEGQYNFYTSSDKVQKCDVVDYKDECILIGTGGNSSIHLTNNFSCSADNLIIKSNKLNNKMIYYSILSIWKILTDSMHGSTIKHVTKEMLKTFNISIPKSPAKIQEWTEKISKPYDEKNMKTNKIASLELKVQNEIKRIMDEEECDEVELGSLCEINSESMKKKQFDYINYINIGSVKEGKINGIKLLNDNYPSRAQRIIKKNDIIFSTVRPNLKGYAFISETIKNCVGTSGFAIIRTKKISPMFIYMLLIDEKITEYLINNATGSNYPAVNPKIFEKIKLKIPHNKQLIQNLEPTFQQIEQLQQEVKQAEQLYNKLILELAEEAIPPSLNRHIVNLENNNIIQEENEDNIEVVDPVIQEEIKEEKIINKLPKSKLIKLTKKQLIDKCTELHIKYKEDYKKEQLIDLLL